MPPMSWAFVNNFSNLNISLFLMYISGFVFLKYSFVHGIDLTHYLCADMHKYGHILYLLWLSF